jgi:predicted DsbA family dithiol-disulfide isomerase
VTAAVSDTKLAIDVISDVVCPWCFIGKRRLEASLAQLAGADPGLKPRVSWQPFQLNPGLPREGVDRKSYLEAKFGGPERAAMIYERVRAAGATVGIAFAFDRIRRQPNTRDAHRLIAWAHENGGEDGAEPLVERLFRAYFLEGRSVGDRDVLAAIAGEAGLDAGAARAMLEADEHAGPVAAMERRARELGVTGVPFFIFDGRVAVSGAQEPRILADAIAEAAKPTRA